MMCDCATERAGVRARVRRKRSNLNIDAAVVVVSTIIRSYVCIVVASLCLVPEKAESEGIHGTDGGCSR